MRRRDFKAEYRRRIQNGFIIGRSRSQARGHPKASEQPVRPKRAAPPIPDDRLQFALKALRQEKSLSAAAKAAKISPERLRRVAVEKNVVERKGRRYVVRRDLPRRVRIFSQGRELTITVGDFDTASLVGRYNAAIGRFLRTNNEGVLGEFFDQTVTDISGKTYALELRRNTLYRLASANDHSFEQIYRIVV